MKTVQRKGHKGIYHSEPIPALFSASPIFKRWPGGGGGEIYIPEKGLFLSANNQLSLTIQNRMFISNRRTELGDEKQECFEITGRYKNGGPEGEGRGKQRVLNDL